MATMLDYAAVNEGDASSAQKRFPFTSDPNVVLVGPAARDWYILRYVSRSYQFDLLGMADAILKAVVTHPDSTWNIRLPMTEATIDTKIQPGDVDALTVAVATYYYPDTFKKDSEGNSSAPTPELEEARPETTVESTATSTQETSTATPS